MSKWQQLETFVRRGAMHAEGVARQPYILINCNEDEHCK